MFIVLGWIAAIWCMLSAISVIGSKQPPVERVLGAVTMFGIAAWIIKALSILP